MGERMKIKKGLQAVGIVLASMLVLFLILAIAFDGTWLRGYLNDRLSDINGRSLVIEGEIDVDLGWTSRISLEDVRFENADWGSEPQMARIDRAEIDLDLLPLLDGEIILPRLLLKDPWLLLETSEQGRHNWELSKESAAGSAGESTGWDPPVIETLIIQGGKIRYRDPSGGTDLAGTIATASAEDGGHRLTIDAEGELLNQPLAFRFTGDPLTDLQEAGIAYQARMAAEMGRSRGEAEGTIHQPLHFQGMDLNVTLLGPDFSTPAALWDEDFPETPPYRIDTRLVLDEGVWRLTETTAELGKSNLKGSIAVDPTGDKFRIEADLESDHLQVDPLRALFRQGESASETDSESPSKSPMDGSFLTALNADIQLRADSIALSAVPLDSGGFHLRLADGRLRLDSLEAELAGGTATASATVQPADPGIRGSAVLDFQNIDLGELGAGEDLGEVSGHLSLELPPVRDPDRIPAALIVVESRLRHQDPTSDTDLTAGIRTVDEAGDHRLEADLSGRYQGRPIDLSITAGTVSDLLDPERSLPVSAAGTVNDQSIRLDAEMARREGSWHLRDIVAKAAGSDLQGDVRVETTGDRPRIVADLDAETLDVAQLTSFGKAIAARTGTPEESAGAEEPSKPDAESPGRETPIDLGALSRFDAEIDIRADRITVPNFPLTDVRLDLELENGDLRISPATVGLDGGTVSVGLSLDTRGDPMSGTVEAAFRQLDLAEILGPFTDLDPESLGVLDGNLRMTAAQADPAALDRDILLPQLGALEIEEGRFSYANPPRDTRLTLSIQSDVSSGRDLPAGITGDGRYRGEPFDLSFRGDPLLHLREPEAPYAFDLEVEAADTRAEVTGALERVFDLKGFDITLDVAGPNPARLYPLIGVSLPDLPPYHLKGRLSLDGGTWKFQDFQGRVGDSDLSGDIRIATAGEKPDLSADLTSESLDFDDLAGLVGAAPETGPEETASPAQRREAARESKDEEVLPEEPYGLERLRALNAAVSYRADRVRSSGLPLDEVNIRFDLAGGRMKFNPLEFEIGDGSVAMNLELQPQDGTFQGLVEAEVKRIDLKRALRPLDFAEDSAGIIGGRAKFWFRGLSPADLLASADGGAYFLMTGGRLDSLLIELIGLDAGEAIVTLFDDRESPRIDCAYVDLHSKAGVITLESFLVDTIDTIFSASGTIRMAEERLDLLLRPRAKDFSLISGQAPIHIQGTFDDPAVFPDRSELAARGAAALGLALVAEPAAILPLIELGAGDEPKICEGLIESIKEARSESR